MNPWANIQGINGLTDTAAGRVVLWLNGSPVHAPIGSVGLLTTAGAVTGYQPLDAELTALAGLTSATDKGIQFTGAGTAATFDLTAAGKALLDDANAAAQLVTLGIIPASDTAIGLIELAIQSEMEAGTDVARAVTPGRQQFHPSAAKVWGFATVSAGVPTLQASHNVTSITDTAVGQMTVTIATDFSSANYSPQVCTQPAALTAGLVFYASIAAGSFQCHSTAAGAYADPLSWSFQCFGDQ